MKWFLRLCFLPLIWLIAQFCQTQTDGFSLSKVAVGLARHRDPLHLPSTLSLDQSFTYLCKGGQCYVFVGTDGKTVLKLFRASRLRLLSPLSALFPQAFAKENAKLNETFQSILLAATHLSDETGLLFVHLGKSLEALPSLKIIDKLGTCHTIDPMTTPFLIQKRALPVKDALLNWRQRGDLEGARQGMLSLFGLIQTERKKQIGDGDPNLVKNFGFCEGKAIQIDVGRFGSSHSLNASKEDLQHFINANLPELSDFFHSLFQPLLEPDEAAAFF